MSNEKRLIVVRAELVSLLREASNAVDAWEDSRELGMAWEDGIKEEEARDLVDGWEWAEAYSSTGGESDRTAFDKLRAAFQTEQR